MVRYDNGVIVHTLNAGAVVDTDAAHTVLELTADLAGGDRVATVIDMRAIAFADRDAREAFARDPSGGVEVATALVIGPKIADFLASRFVRGAQPERPIAMFDTVDEAMEWAADQVAAAS